MNHPQQSALLMLVLLLAACPDSATTDQPDVDSDAVEEVATPDVDPEVAGDAEADDVSGDLDVDDVQPADDLIEDTAEEVADDLPEVARQDTAGSSETVIGTLPGNTCSSAIVIDALPWSHMADANAYTDNYSVNSQCGLADVAGAGAGDVVYAFKAVISGEHVILIDSDAGSTFAFIATSCEDMTGSCVEASPKLIPGSQWKVPLTAGTDYLLVVDGWTAQNQGLFKMTMHGPCIVNCSGKLCGPDGCGGICGQCTGGKICSQGSCISFSPSCKDACGQYIPGATCQCDAGCFDSETDGCCPNVCTYCSDNFTEQCGPQPGKGSCKDLCGFYADGAACQCDLGCFGLDDCCPDVCTECIQAFPEQCKP
jgi:hypothetical protein